MKKILLIRDLPEEEWPSMELCADMLEAELAKLEEPPFEFHSFTPRYIKIPNLFGKSLSRKLSLFISRYIILPHAIKKQKADLYHIIDHSYGHLLHVLPPEKTLITCHDTEIFSSAESRKTPWWTRKVCQHVCKGIAKGRHFICVSKSTSDLLLKKLPLKPATLEIIHNGTAPWFRADAEEGEQDHLRKKFQIPEHYILHVGSTVPRKNIEFLLDAMKQFKLIPDLVRLEATRYGCRKKQKEEEFKEEYSP